MTYSSSVLADSPLAYYRLADTSGTTATDSSGNTRNGTYSGTPTLAVTGLIPGDADKAVTLAAGSSQEVQSSSNAALSAANMIHEHIVKSSDLKQWVRDNTSAGGTGWMLDLSGTNVAIRISGTTYTSTYPCSNLRDGNGHLIHWGADGSNVYIYADGFLRYSAARGATTVPTLPWHLGRNGTGTGSANYTTGTFDEWAIYSSLSASQVATRYAQFALVITVPAATATVDMLPPAVRIDLNVPVPPATVAVAMVAPLVRLTSFFSAYDLDANSSQALNVRITMDATLVGNPLPSALPSHFTDPQIRARRLSLVMPAPSLDSRGRPT